MGHRMAGRYGDRMTNITTRFKIMFVSFYDCHLPALSTCRPIALAASTAHTPPCGCGYYHKVVAVAVEPQTATNFQFFLN